MSRYVPTTDDVKTNYASSMYAHNKGRKIDPHRIFDSWIIAHDAEMREQIAREIEIHMRRHDNAQIGFSAVGDAYAHAASIARGRTRASVELVERCERCGCDLQYPTAVHIVDCGTREEQD